ncbi:MAG: hypothetical protein LBI63_00295 [Candidatus Ancillula sp.]|jgi:hypothetical protein|nr:hypothetical protein [Candidatus Ancillula sp.]
MVDANDLELNIVNNKQQEIKKLKRYIVAIVAFSLGIWLSIIQTGISSYSRAYGEELDEVNNFSVLQVETENSKTHLVELAQEKVDEQLPNNVHLNVQKFADFQKTSADSDTVYFGVKTMRDGSTNIVPLSAGDTFVRRWCDDSSCGLEIHISADILRAACLTTVAGIAVLLHTAGIASVAGAPVTAIADLLLGKIFGDCWNIQDGFWVVLTYTPGVWLNGWGRQ